MAPRTEEQFEIIRQEKKMLIKQTALELFANEGYHATTISKIAKKAGISKGLLYNYFESKEHLIKEIFQEASSLIWKYFDPNHDGTLTKDEFVFFIQQSFRVVKENVHYWKLYSALMFQENVSNLIMHDFDDLGRNVMTMLLDLFKRCECEDPEWEIFLFGTILKGAIIQYLANPDMFPLDMFEKKLINFYSKKLEL